MHQPLSCAGGKVLAWAAGQARPYMLSTVLNHASAVLLGHGNMEGAEQGASGCAYLALHCPLQSMHSQNTGSAHYKTAADGMQEYRSSCVHYTAKPLIGAATIQPDS